jgi:hypothetical protein
MIDRINIIKLRGGEPSQSKSAKKYLKDIMKINII